MTMAGREQPTGRIPQIVPGPERFLGRQRRGGAPRGGVPVFARDAPRLASVASRPTSATTGSTPPGAPPAPSFRGRVTKRTQRGCKRKARTRPQDCGAGTKKRTLFDNVNTTTANGSLRAPRLRAPHSRVPDERRRSRSEDPGPRSYTAKSMDIETSRRVAPGSRIFAR